MTSLVTRVRDEDGMALLISVIIMLMISAIGLTALQSAQDESSGSGRSRRKVTTLAAATSAMGLVEQKLDTTTKQYPDLNPLNETAFMTDHWGGATDVRSGTSDTPAAQPIRRVGSETTGQINVGGKNTLSFGVYRADVTAVDATGGVVELQAQYAISEGSQSY